MGKFQDELGESMVDEFEAEAKRLQAVANNAWRNGNKKRAREYARRASKYMRPAKQRAKRQTTPKAKCLVRGCDRVGDAAKGWCMRHYQAHRRGQKMHVGPRTRRDAEKISFRVSTDERNILTNTATADGWSLAAWCREAALVTARYADKKRKKNS